MQSALVASLTAWTAKGLPENPGAWLYCVAHNHVIGELRRRAGQARILEKNAGDLREGDESAEPRFADEMRDDLLRMLFVCCDEAIPPESRLVLALKTLCGFSTAEIALRLFTTEANVFKRLGRARERLRESPPNMELPPPDEQRARLPSVHVTLYLLFNEGYLSANTEQAIRSELCDEAIRLATLLAENPAGAIPETFALLALMNFHAARLPARIDGIGQVLLLEEQDRTLWDRERLGLGMQWLSRSASGEAFSRYHAEAAIAAEHCLSPSFQETRWKEIADLYSILERIAPSPLHTLNRAVAVAEWQGPAAGLAVLEGLVRPPWLEGSHLWDAVFADLHRRTGDLELARRHATRALEAAPSTPVRELLRRRLGM